MHTLLRHGDAIDPRDEHGAVLFHHIPKCAGVSFGILLKASANGRFMLVDSVGDQMRLKDLDAGRWTLSGHNLWGCHAELPGNRWIAYITFLRNPEKIALSYYKFVRTVGFFPPQTGFEDFLLDHYRHNHLVAWLGSGDLELAKDRLANTFMHFGIVEEFDRSVRNMADDLGLPGVQPPQVNVSAKSPLGFPQHLKEHFLELNALDVALYGWAVDLFQKRCREATAGQPGGTPTAAVHTSWNTEVTEAWASRDYDLAIHHIVHERSELYRHEYEALIVLYKSKGDIEKAVRACREGNAVFPLLFDIQLADLLIVQGEAEQAARLLREHDAALAEIRAGFPDAWILARRAVALLVLARAQYAQGLRAQALETIQKAAAQERVDCLERLRMVRWLCEQGEYAAAGQLHQAIAEPQGRSEKAEWLSLAAKLLMAGGDPAAAMDKHEKALALAPFRLQVLQEAVVSARKCSRHEWAVRRLREYRETVTSPDLLYASGRELSATLFEAGELSAAQEVFSSLASGTQDKELAALAPFQAGASRDGLGLAACLGGKRRMLLVRACPWVHFFFFSGLLEPVFHGHVDVLTASPEFLSGQDRFRAVLPLPAGHNVSARQLPELDRALFRERYDAVVLLTSSPDPAACANIMQLAQAIPCADRFLYSVTQATSLGFRDLLLPLGREGGAEAGAPGAELGPAA